jgi:hypothetical protein
MIVRLAVRRGIRGCQRDMHLPKHVWLLLALYFIASLAHFSHNAEYIAFYPNLPAWLTREKVYLAWLAITSVGVVGTVLAAAGWRSTAALLFAAYGLFGLDGLAHYTLALCSEHTFAMNFSIWFEVAGGAALAVSAGLFAAQTNASQR